MVGSFEYIGYLVFLFAISDLKKMLSYDARKRYHSDLLIIPDAVSITESKLSLCVFMSVYQRTFLILFHSKSDCREGCRRVQTRGVK